MLDHICVQIARKMPSFLPKTLFKVRKMSSSSHRIESESSMSNRVTS